jgi:hypothetical protein
MLRRCRTDVWPRMLVFKRLVFKFKISTDFLQRTKFCYSDNDYNRSDDLSWWLENFMQITNPRKEMKLFHVMYSYTVHTKNKAAITCQEIMKSHCCPFQCKPHIFYSSLDVEFVSSVRILLSGKSQINPGKPSETDQIILYK